MNGIEPADSGEPEGGGNGVLMKLAPLAYWQHVQGMVKSRAAKDITELTRMTHRAPEATVASLAHPDVLKGLMRLGINIEPEIEAVIEQAAHNAVMYEQKLTVDAITSVFLGNLVDVVKRGDLTPETIVALAPGGGFYAPETLVMAYGSFLRENTFPYSAYRAVELGGDTDSIASIVASMSVCVYGDVEIPHDIDLLFDFPRLTAASHHLARVAMHFDH